MDKPKGSKLLITDVTDESDFFRIIAGVVDGG